jgi:hypothetical protein
MGRVVKLNEEFVLRVTKEAKLNKRSVPKQIEFNYALAAAALDNPDLPIHWVRDLLIAKDSTNAKRVKWIDDALLRIAAEEDAKKAARKPKRASVKSASGNRKKSVSR